MTNQYELSLVIPVYNEQDNLRKLMQEINSALEPIKIPYEVIFVDDGSTDASLAVLSDISEDYPKARYISFEENRGQSAAFCAGFDEAKAPRVATMDADLQNDPADLPAMLSLYNKGHEMVIGWREKRRDVWIKRIASKIANAIRNRLTRESVKDTGCSLKIMDTTMVREIPRFNGMHRFLPTLMKMQGASVAEVKVNHRPRHQGESKYGTIDRAIAGGYDLLGVRWIQSRHFSYKIKERSNEKDL
ncbi:glycosyltransferase family 2 protein [Maridesulfovibrio zosterae]|uniref:glycosyltransferase family 2 protein n=1 Tax=Maridesulfovibrio zosterae TaxID=82171 RepID=UPI00041BBEFF|nr:glycosyltransferase family 2 protein [Maridesulfovibrio zosterae]